LFPDVLCRNRIFAPVSAERAALALPPFLAAFHALSQLVGVPCLLASQAKLLLDLFPGHAAIPQRDDALRNGAVSGVGGRTFIHVSSYRGIVVVWHGFCNGRTAKRKYGGMGTQHSRGTVFAIQIQQNGIPAMTELREAPMAKTTVELPDGLHRKLRVKAALENRSMNEIMIAAVKGYLQNFRLEPEMLEVETVPRQQQQHRESHAKEGTS
jgi:plasmid stability protein